MEIKSDFTGAKEKATTLKRAAESVIAKAEPTKDNQTTVSGNTNAKEAITLARETAKQISEVILSASNNIESVAKEFKAFDEFSSKSFHLPN